MMAAVKVQRKNKVKKSERNMFYSSKRLALIIFCCIYSIVVLGDLFFELKVQDNVLTSLEILIGSCIGGITVSKLFKK